MAGNSIAIGIDLGTSNSCVAVFRNGTVEIIANEEGSRTTPSMVSFTNKDRLLGNSSKLFAVENPKNTVYGIKRIIGRSFDEKQLQADIQTWPFLVTRVGKKPKISVTYRNEKIQYTPEEISAMILTKMKEIAESYLEQKVTHAVITVPASFNDSQKKATFDAGKIAGLNVMRIINEPTAAAIAYGMDKKVAENRNVLVFDMGGGTFDVSILSIKDGKFRVRAVAGDTHLGGEDIDNRMLFHCVENIRRDYKKNIRTNKKAELRLKKACEDAKKNLSIRLTTTIAVDSLLDGIDYNVTITRNRFEEINADLFLKTLKPLQKAMKDAKMAKNDIDDIVLVGGSTRIPKIQALLQEYFDGKSLCRGINPDEAVAYGAAIQAAMLHGNKCESIKDLQLVDVTPLSLGIETKNGKAFVIIPRNTAIPTKKTMKFPTSVDNQDTVRVTVFEGEHELCKDNTVLGTFLLNGIPRAPKGEVDIKITFEIDSNGILNVSATEETFKIINVIKITNDQGRLSDKEITRMMQEAKNNDAEDEKQRSLAFRTTELEEYVNSIIDAIKFKFNKKISQMVKMNILDECHKIIELLSSHRVNSVHECLLLKEGLEKLWKPISENSH